MTRYLCGICKQFAFESRKKVFVHIMYAHKELSSEQIEANILPYKEPAEPRGN